MKSCLCPFWTADGLSSVPESPFDRISSVTRAVYDAAPAISYAKVDVSYHLANLDSSSTDAITLTGGFSTVSAERLSFLVKSGQSVYNIIITSVRDLKTFSTGNHQQSLVALRTRSSSFLVHHLYPSNNPLPY